MSETALPTETGDGPIVQATPVAGALDRVVWKWTGGQLGTGYSVFWFDAGAGTAQQALDATRAFFSTAYGSPLTELPSNITLRPPNVVDVVEPESGSLMSSLSVTPGADLAGFGSQAYAAPAGCCVTWLTGAFLTGTTGKARRLRGRTFLVPVSGSGLQADGTLSVSMVNQATTAAANLLAGVPKLVTYHRPLPGATTGGVAYQVIGSKITDQGAILRSRRH